MKCFDNSRTSLFRITLTCSRVPCSRREKLNPVKWQTHKWKMRSLNCGSSAACANQRWQLVMVSWTVVLRCYAALQNLVTVLVVTTCTICCDIKKLCTVHSHVRVTLKNNYYYRRTQTVFSVRYELSSQTRCALIPAGCATVMDQACSR
jgi:hypothetical protein